MEFYIWWTLIVVSVIFFDPGAILWIKSVTISAVNKVKGWLKKMQESIAIYAGSFDPFTKGHAEFVKKVWLTHLFSKIIILVVNNPAKSHMFSMIERVNIIDLSLKKYMWLQDFIEIRSTTGKTVDFISGLDAQNKILVRGLRDGYDLAYENQLTTINSHLKENLQTIYIPCDPEYWYISSTLVRTLVENDGSIYDLVNSPEAEKYIKDSIKMKKELV